MREALRPRHSLRRISSRPLRGELWLLYRVIGLFPEIDTDRVEEQQGNGCIELSLRPMLTAPSRVTGDTFGALDFSGVGLSLGFAAR